MDNRNVGFFDSGLGGLTCIIHMLKNLPNEGITYFGDTARTPYGSKSIDNIQSFSLQIAEFLVRHKNVKMLVIACNTISSTAMEYLQMKYPEIPIIGITEPAAQRIAAQSSEGERIGIIGTQATVASNMYENLMYAVNPELEIFSKACPMFVPFIEEGIINSPIMREVIKLYLDPLVYEDKISTLILGCTHYPLIADQIKKEYPHLKIIDPAEIIMPSISEMLQANDIMADSSRKTDKFYASDLSDNFIYMVRNIFEIEGMRDSLNEIELEAVDLDTLEYCGNGE